MYSVLIIDGDAQIRSSLKYIVNWEQLGCKVAATSKNGEEAWNIYLQIQPSIILMDIQLEKLDGIELIKRIKVNNPYAQVIVISNRYAFEKVKQSMKVGAFDFLIKKDLKSEDLFDVLSQIKKHLVESDEKTMIMDERATIKLQQCMVLKKNDHAVSEEEFKHALMDETFRPFRDNLQVAYFRLDNVNLVYHSQIVDHEKLHHDIESIINNCCMQLVEYKVVFISNHSGIIMFAKEDKRSVIHICDSIMMEIIQSLKLKVSITLSDCIHRIDEFYRVYETLLELHEMRFYFGESVLIQTEELPRFREFRYDEINAHIKIIDCFRQRDFQNIEEWKLSALYFMKENFIKPEHVRSFFIFIMNNIEGNEIEKGIKNTFHFEEILERIAICETIDKLNEILDEAFFLLEKWIIDNQQNRYRQDVIEIMNYVDLNITKKLNLKMISGYFNMNESYVSRMFKHETGKNLMYYINEKKMQKALELLSNSQHMIKEVAYQVGMEDQFYFNKVFKKFYQISPSEFRRKLKQKGEKIST